MSRPQRNLISDHGHRLCPARQQILEAAGGLKRAYGSAQIISGFAGFEALDVRLDAEWLGRRVQGDGFVASQQRSRLAQPWNILLLRASETV